MNSKRLYYVMLGSIVFLVAGLIGGAFGANSLLQSEAQNLIKARSKSSALDQQQTQLVKAKASIAKYQSVATIAKNVVPTDKDQAQTVREIVKIADANGVRLSVISFPSSSLGGTGVTGSAPESAAASKLSQLKAAVGLPGIYTLQISVVSEATNPVSYDQFVTFLSDLERNRRTALVSAVALQPSVKDLTRVTFTLTIDEYIKS